MESCLASGNYSTVLERYFAGNAASPSHGLRCAEVCNAKAFVLSSNHPRPSQLETESGVKCDTAITSFPGTFAEIVITIQRGVGSDFITFILREVRSIDRVDASCEVSRLSIEHISFPLLCTRFSVAE